MRALIDAVDAGRTVLAPTAEIAAAIQGRLEGHFAAGGREVWVTPQIRDLSSWIRQQHQLQNFDRAGAPRILSDLEERQIWREVIARSPVAEEFSDPGGAARSARRASRAMREYRIPREALSSFPNAESDALSRWLEDFELRCRSLNAIGADGILESLGPPGETPAWIESPSWHPRASQWLRENAHGPLPPQGAAAGRDARSSICIYRCFESEIAACAEWARVNRRQYGDFRAWIFIAGLAAKRGRVAAAFDAALVPGRFGISEHLGVPPYAIAGGTPLAGLEPVRIALQTLTATCETLSFARFSALLRAPSLQAGFDDAVSAARLDDALRSRAPSEAGLRDWLELCGRVAAAKSLQFLSSVDRLRAIDATLGSARSDLNLSQWVPLWIRSLDAGPWAGRSDWSSAAYQAAERFRELQGALACADQVYGAMSKQAAIRALATAANETAFQAQTGVAPVWVTDQPADPWLDFDGIWIAGAGADEWPPAAAPLPLIPVQLQRQFGVAGATAAQQLQRSMDLQRRWLQRCPRIVFSCSSETGIPAAPSALLPADARVDGGTIVVEDPLIHKIRMAGVSLEPFTDAAGPEFTSDERTRGTFSLREQSQCAFRGFAMTRLRSDRLELPTPGFTDMERGIVLHAALEFIWSRLGGSERLSGMADADLAALIGDAVDRAILVAALKRDPGAHWRAREARRLKRLLPLWLKVESEREPFQVLELEAERRGMKFGGLEFNIRIDRIDRLGDGTLVLIDYKSGAVRTDWEGDRPDNPQLPIYALSVNGPVTAVAYAQVQARSCRFAGVAGRDKVLPRVRAARGDAERGMEGALALWAARIGRIADELRTGAARVSPTPAACASCHLQGFCRISSGGDPGDVDARVESADAG